jgi:hypothetical protein
MEPSNEENNVLKTLVISKLQEKVDALEKKLKVLEKKFNSIEEVINKKSEFYKMLFSNLCTAMLNVMIPLAFGLVIAFLVTINTINLNVVKNNGRINSLNKNNSTDKILLEQKKIKADK